MSGLELLDGRVRPRLVDDEDDWDVAAAASLEIRDERWVVKARVEEEVRSFLLALCLERWMP
jgi:hypothetical protein